MGQSGPTVPVGQRDHAEGPVDAHVTLVEYGDCECSLCAYAYWVVKVVQAVLGNQLRFVSRNFPLATSHPHTRKASEAAEAAGGQGAFWQMHDLLFENHHLLDSSSLGGYAKTVGLDVTLFEQDLQNHTCAQQIRDDFRGSLERWGIQHSPR